MKKILLLFFIGLLFVNCKKSEVKEIQGEDAFEMQTELIGFNEEAGQYQVTFTANVTKWVATVGEASKEWLTISPTSGGKGEHTLTIEYTANEQTHIRMGEITIYSGQDSLIFPVYQAGSAPFGLIDDDEIKVSHKAGSTTFRFISNVDDWSVTNTEEWLTISPTSGGKGVKTLTIQYAENTDKENERNATIKIGNNDDSFELTFVQNKWLFDIFTVIEDATFKSYCQQFDDNGDGILSLGEAAEENNVIVNEKNIQSLKGIEYFTSLTRLSCMNNAITDLNLSKNIALTRLECSGNKLSSLDVSQNTALTRLDCANNNLSTLDVSNNTALTFLDCTGNPDLKTLYLHTGQEIEKLHYDETTTIEYK